MSDESTMREAARIAEMFAAQGCTGVCIYPPNDDRSRAVTAVRPDGTPERRVVGAGVEQLTMKDQGMRR